MRTASGRIVLLSSGITALVLLTFSVSLYLWVEQDLRAELSERLDARFRDVLGSIVKSKGDPALLRDDLASLESIGGAIVKIVRVPERTIYASDEFEAAAPAFQVRSARVGSPSDPYDVSVGLDRRPLERALDRMRMYFAVFVPAVVLLTAVAVRTGVRRVLSPIEGVRSAAERISRENVSERLPLEGLGGEFLALARTFNEMLDRLEKAMQDLQSFAADAAHELRTPLSNLRAEIETAARQERSREEHERILDSAAEDVSRMARIVDDLLTLARLDLRQHALAKEPVSVLPLLEETRESWEEPAEAKGITISVQGDEARVPGDPVALRRVFSNLVHNAVQYARPGDRVVLAAARRGDRAEVRVEDTGPGIAAEHLPLLFRRFYRIDPARTRSSGGAGLGLAICKSFVDAHGGTISVTSEVGRGTVFIIDLPALEGSAEPAFH